VTATLAYAFTLGLVAAVNPCGFPLLPAYLALFAGDDARPGVVARTSRGLVAGICVTLGFVAVFGVAGILAESGLTLVLTWVPWVMIVLGCAMVALGARGLAGGSIRIPFGNIRFAPGRSITAMAGFGIAYAVASLSCALPLFLASVAGAFTRISVTGGLALFIAYAAGMGAFVIAASIVASHLGAGALRRIRPATRFIPRLGSAVLMLVGAYLAYYWINELLDPLATPPLVGFVDTVQSAVNDWISRFSLDLGLGLAAIVLIGCAVLALARIRRHSREERAHA